jgi:ATP-dependent Clp protease ATP-binding subunit ClpC
MLRKIQFTARVLRVITFAEEQAARHGQPDIGPEHLLLGLLREKDSVGTRLLERLGVNLRSLRGEVERGAVCGDVRTGSDLQLSPGGQRVIDFADEESRRLDNRYIGTEHILSGLLRDEDGIAARALADAGVTLEAARLDIEALQ